jgi:Apea-like HEPN
MASEWPPVIDKKVSAAASRFLAQAFAEARRQQIIPKIPRHSRWQRYDGPWPPYWACWEIARGEIAAPFIAALREAYPARFGEESKFPYKDPETYARAYLSAVIADSVIRADRLSVKSPAAISMLHELQRVVSIEGQRFGVLWLLEDVDFRAVAKETVGDITLLPPSSPPEVLVSNLLPGALWASDDYYPMPGAKHAGLLYASGAGTGHHWDVTTPLNNAMGRFMQALRLATATTAPETMVWIGEPSMIHVELPEAHRQASDFPETWWRRVATVTPDILPGLRRLTAMIDRLEQPKPTRKKGQGALPAIVIAIRRHSRSRRVTTWQDSVLELATALEACLGPQGRDQEIGLTLRTRAAHLLAHDDSEQADAIYRDITDLYGVRSDIIHGNPEWKKDPQTLWAERGYTHIFERDRTYALLDGWRDIVRRAISARLMLADERLGTPLWPLIGDETPVDRLLARRDKRDEWRARIVEGAAAYGLPLLADPAPPLIDYLNRSGKP